MYLGTVDTLKEAVQRYNKEARNRGKPEYRLPLEAPKINKISTAVPGLPNINLLTADGKFMMQFTPLRFYGGPYFSVRADTLDEAVKAYNEERVEHRLSTHKITAEHRAVVEEMQRRRKLFVAERSKRREKLARQPAAAPVTRACSKVPAPPPKPGKTRPARATAPPTPKPGRDARESAPTPNPEPVERGAAAAGAEAGAAAAPQPPRPAPRRTRRT